MTLSANFTSNPFLTCKAVARYTFALARLSCSRKQRNSYGA